MNMDQIISSLKKTFDEPLKDEEVRKLVFWMDYDKEFMNDFEKVQIDNVKEIKKSHSTTIMFYLPFTLM